MTPTRVRELFNYDPDTGHFERSRDYGRGLKGQTFETENVMVDGIRYRLTHLIWCCQHGEWPPEGYWIDHKDGVKANRKLSNLRLATPTQNQQNKAGYGQYAKGVTWRNRKVKPWQAKIRVNGERIHLGSFETEEEAAEAYRQASSEYHGDFACHD